MKFKYIVAIATASIIFWEIAGTFSKINVNPGAMINHTAIAVDSAPPVYIELSFLKFQSSGSNIADNINLADGMWSYILVEAKVFE